MVSSINISSLGQYISQKIEFSVEHVGVMTAFPCGYSDKTKTNFFFS
jgi:hypothetical protein